MATPGTLDYPTALDGAVSLIEATNRASSTLSATLNAGVTTASLTSAASFPTSGTITIENEIIYYTGKSGNDLTGLIRGREGTSDASHSSGLDVEGRITARHHTVLADGLVAVETKLGYGSDTPVAGDFLIGSGTGTSGWGDTSTGRLQIETGGADAITPPNVIGTTEARLAVGGSYADSGSGNIYQLTSWCENTGTRPIVGVFGLGKASGSGAKAWGGNFVAYANHATAGNCIALEINAGRLVSGSGGAYGIVVSNYGGNGMTNHIQMQTGATGSVATDGIVFESGTGFEPVSGRMIRTSGICNATHGIDFSSGVFSTYGITIGTNSLLAGLGTHALDSDTAQVLLELENLSDNANTTKGAVLAFVGRDTVNSRKNAAYIQALPQDSNWIAGDLSFHTRVTNTLAERMRLSSAALTLADAINVIVGTTTGTKIGTSTSQKIGFFNATPVVQPSAYTVTNVTTDRAYDANSYTMDELADVLGTLITDLKSLGLIG